MVRWLVEIEGQQRPSTEIADTDFASAVQRLQQFFANSMTEADVKEMQRLNVVCRFDPRTGLRFRLQGPRIVVKRALERFGESSPRQETPSGKTLNH